MRTRKRCTPRVWRTSRPRLRHWSASRNGTRAGAEGDVSSVQRQAGGVVVPVHHRRVRSGRGSSACAAAAYRHRAHARVDAKTRPACRARPGTYPIGHPHVAVRALVLLVLRGDHPHRPRPYSGPPRTDTPAPPSWSLRYHRRGHCVTTSVTTSAVAHRTPASARRRADRRPDRPAHIDAHDLGSCPAPRRLSPHRDSPR